MKKTVYTKTKWGTVYAVDYEVGGKTPQGDIIWRKIFNSARVVTDPEEIKKVFGHADAN